MVHIINQDHIDEQFAQQLIISFIHINICTDIAINFVLFVLRICTFHITLYSLQMNIRFKYVTVQFCSVSWGCVHCVQCDVYCVGGVLGNFISCLLGSQLNIILNVFFYFFCTVYCLCPFGKAQVFQVGNSFFQDNYKMCLSSNV